MALSVRNYGLPRNTNSLLLKNKYFNNLPSKNTLRHLRGSKNGRTIYRTEAKFQELIKSLNKHEEDSLNLTKIPEKSTDSQIERKWIDPQSYTLVVPQGSAYDKALKRLDDKITPLKNYTYAKQLEKKYNKSLNVLRDFSEKLKRAKVPITIGSDRLPCPVELMLPSPIIESYRNQDEFSIGIGVDGNPKTVGFFLEDPDDQTKTICVGPGKLVVVKDNHKKFVKDFERYIRNSPLDATTSHDDEGFWKSVKMKSNMDGDLMGIVSVRSHRLSEEQIAEEKKKLYEYFSASGESYKLKSLHFQEIREKKAVRYTSQEEPCDRLFGDEYLIEEMDYLKLHISPESYFMPNTAVAASMYGILQRMCRMHSSNTVLDICCGIGAASLVFSNRVKKCIGIDLALKNIADAKLNIVKNGIDNVEFLLKLPEAALHDINQSHYYDDLIAVISPGKQEVSKPVVSFLRRCKHLNKIIYITTKPTIALDNFVDLCKPAGKEACLGKPFVPLFAIPADLLPQTHHFALAVVFQRF